MVLAWTWTSSGRSPVRVPGERHGVWLLLLVPRDGCGAGECVFLDYPLTQSRRVRRGVSQRRLLEEFPVLGVHALFARGNLVHYSSTTLYLAVYSSVFGCCMWSTEHWILREVTLSGVHCLVRQWIRGLHQYLAFERISHNFYVYEDSDPEVFLFSHAEWRIVLSRCFSSLSFGALLALGTLETLLMASSWLACVMMGGRVSAQALAHVYLVSVTCIVVVRLW